MSDDVPIIFVKTFSRFSSVPYKVVKYSGSQHRKGHILDDAINAVIFWIAAMIVIGDYSNASLQEILNIFSYSSWIILGALDMVSCDLPPADEPNILLQLTS